MVFCGRGDKFSPPERFPPLFLANFRQHLWTGRDLMYNLLCHEFRLRLRGVACSIHCVEVLPPRAGLPVRQSGGSIYLKIYIIYLLTASSSKTKKFVR